MAKQPRVCPFRNLSLRHCLCLLCCVRWGLCHCIASGFLTAFACPELTPHGSVQQQPPVALLAAVGLGHGRRQRDTSKQKSQIKIKTYMSRWKSCTFAGKTSCPGDNRDRFLVTGCKSERWWKMSPVPWAGRWRCGAFPHEVYESLLLWVPSRGLKTPS